MLLKERCCKTYNLRKTSFTFSKVIPMFNEENNSLSLLKQIDVLTQENSLNTPPSLAPCEVFVSASLYSCTKFPSPPPQKKRYLRNY